jgi:hypothetical protein
VARSTGETSYHQMTIVEYPSPRAFADMGAAGHGPRRHVLFELFLGRSCSQ